MSGFSTEPSLCDPSSCYVNFQLDLEFAFIFIVEAEDVRNILWDVSNVEDVFMIDDEPLVSYF